MSSLVSLRWRSPTLPNNMSGGSGTVTLTIDNIVVAVTGNMKGIWKECNAFWLGFWVFGYFMGDRAAAPYFFAAGLVPGTQTFTVTALPDWVRRIFGFTTWATPGVFSARAKESRIVSSGISVLGAFL